MSCVLSPPVSGDITAGCDLRPGVVLPGPGVCLALQAPATRAPQLPVWGITPGSAGQDLHR